MIYEISVFPGAVHASQATKATRQQLTSLMELSHTIKLNTWAPSLFKEDQRSIKNFESTSMLVLDIDDGCLLADAEKIFAPYKHIIGTSKSHQKEKNGVITDRFRVILFLDSPVNSDSDFKSAWFAAFEKWPFIDGACKDSARLFYPCYMITSVNEDGALFSERVVQVTKAPSQPATRQLGKGKLSRATKDFLAEGAAPGEWHPKFIKAAIDLKEQGYDIEEAQQKLSLATGHLDETDEQQLLDIYENRETKYPARGVGKITDWPVYVQTKAGEVLDRSHPDNLKHMINRLGYKFKLNDMNEMIYSDNELLTDFDLNYLWAESKRQGLDAGKDFIAAEIGNMATGNRYHPIKDLIEGVKPDGEDHIGALFATLTLTEDGAESANLYAEYLKKWIVGVMAKLYRPGSQNLVLTFVGAQGIGKSRWLSKLALWSEAFGEGAVDPGNKDHELRHLTHLIWHIPELDYTTGKRETGALKDYLTRESVSVRPAYARYVRTGKSICSFAASVNSEDFLIDQTGNRRFLVIPIEILDHNHKVNMQQVFAQAKALLDSGYQYWLDVAEIAKLNELNADFELHDRVTEAALTIEAGQDEMSAIELLETLGFEQPSWGDITRFGSILRKRGFKRRRRRLNGKQTRFYCVHDPKKAKKSIEMPTVLQFPKPPEST